jgi:hypothetical protein
MLPGATVTIEPATEPIDPVSYVIDVAQPERVEGTARAQATVTATGTYDIERPASGTVTLFNWSAFDQAIPAGTLVAAGDQAFETVADVVVPTGLLTPFGTILAGEADVGVVASAPGPAGNVDATAIDTILSTNADARLRGFRNNDQRRVENREPTTGGVDRSGVEITQADVDAAVETLTADMSARVAAAIDEQGDAIVAQSEAAEPRINGLEDLVGTRDQAEATISGRLRWEALTADRNEVIEAARQQLVDDPSVVPDGHALLPASVEVEVGEASLSGDAMRVDVTASGLSAAQIDGNEVAARIAGLAPADAEAALADLGSASIDLWPDWVGSVPAMTWRIEVRVAER